MADRAQLAVSEYVRDVVKGVKMEKEHRNYDSTLRQIINEAGIDADYYVEMVRSEEENEEEANEDVGQEDGNEIEPSDNDKNLESMGFDFDW